MKLSDEMIPYRIDIPESALEDLRLRLKRARWPDKLPGPGRNYGAELSYIQKLTHYWLTAYDWRKQESRLNEYPQFMTSIDGANIHFMHIRSPEPGALPLILSHGWPGSIVEFLELIGPLTNPRAYGGDPADAFHVVIPSLPGFGLSGPTQASGWSFHRMACAFAELMRRLGYDRYGAQGGDWGSAITRGLATVDPEHVIGAHVNYLPLGDVQSRPEEETAAYKKNISRGDDIYGYLKIQATRPQTLAYGLSDSPVGQLAWIAEKFKDWTDPSQPVDRDQLLTNVMLYWLTGTGGSAARIYYETAMYRKRAEAVVPQVPMGVAVFPYELSQPLRSSAEEKYNIVHWSELDRGGHFAAMEAPDLLTEDLRTFFRRFRSNR